MPLTAKPLDRFVSLNGLRFHYRQWGDATAPPLILLHGVASHGHFWDRFGEAMADRFRVLALDQRGHGETDWASAYSTDLMVADLEALAVSHSLPSFCLIGHSMGGRNAFVYATRYPERVQRLVIVDIGPTGSVTAPSRVQQAALVRAGARATFTDPERAVQSARRQNPRPAREDLRRTTLANLIQRADGAWVWRYDAAGLSARTPEQRAPSEERQWELLAQITVPTLLVRGAESEQLSRGVAEQMAEVVSDCRLVEVPNSGHPIPLDNPEGFLTAVRPFLLDGRS